MIEDNTPTVTARRRKPTPHMRLRLETAKKLRALGVQRKAKKESAREGVNQLKTGDGKALAERTIGIETRSPKVKKASLATPPLPKAKFRKRQKNKTWLPTHLFHAKRARMTPPKEPLWRFAIPLTPTAKCYRPTHRAANERGAIAWDMSYVSTIGLEGQQRSVEGVLSAIGIGSRSGEGVFGSKGDKWRNGTRAWTGFASQREAPYLPIAPVTILWCPPSMNERPNNDTCKMKRQIMVRVHPSAFWTLWEELTRASKTAKPQVSIEDLRFEVGSIEITGPGAFETMQGVLWPFQGAGSQEKADSSARSVWESLGGMENPVMLPQSVVFGFDVQDPRLHHPPRTFKARNTAADHNKVLEILAKWPLDAGQAPYNLFDRRSRRFACSALPSQKAINRRRALTTPGQHPEVTDKDPRIPAMVYFDKRLNGRQTTFTILVPWKCVQTCWYSIMYYPLSTGGQPRFGGIDEKMQLAFECGQPSFPRDFPGTQSGWAHELVARRKREEDWKRRPKSKRVNWSQVNLGNGKRGEVGRGWACDWERLLKGPPTDTVQTDQGDESSADKNKNDASESPRSAPPAAHGFPELVHVTAEQAGTILRGMSDSDASCTRSLATVRIDLLNRGVPETCARVYRLPSSANVQKQWLDLHPRNQRQRPRQSKNAIPRVPKDAPDHIRRQRLAQSLIDPTRADDDDYPPCPDEDDLIGFVTTGNYNLGEGQGTGIGSILLSRVGGDVHTDPQIGRLCVVRNAGNGVARLGQWEIV